MLGLCAVQGWKKIRAASYLLEIINLRKCLGVGMAEKDEAIFGRAVRRCGSKVPGPTSAPPISHKAAFLAFRTRKEAGIEDGFWLSTTRV